MSETVEVTGTVERIGDLQTFDSGFTKREVVVNTGGQYPDQIGVEFLKDDTAKVDALNVGDSIIVTGFLGGRDVECRDGTTRNFLSIKAIRVQSDQAAPSAAVPDQDAPSGDVPIGDDDNFPF